MAVQKELKDEISAKTQDYAKNTAKTNYSVGRRVARGAGFEPARPKGPQA